LMYRLLI